MEQLKKIISNIPHEIKIICPLKKGQISEIYLCNFNNIKSVIRLDLDCLLYTSPSPRDATLSRMPSSA